MKFALATFLFCASTLALEKPEPGHIFGREEKGCVPGFCAPCSATSSGNLAGMFLGAGLVFGTAWFRRKK